MNQTRSDFTSSLGDVGRSLDIDAPLSFQMSPANMKVAGCVDDVADTASGTPNRIGVRDVPLKHLDV